MDSDVMISYVDIPLVACEICGVEVEKRKAGPHKSGHVRAAKSRYVYKDGDSHHPYELRSCPTCREAKLIRVGYTYCSHRCSKMGGLNPAKAKSSGHRLSKSDYVRAHEVVRSARGKAFGCSLCGTQEQRMYHWANISGDYWDTEDYISLCVPCHDRFDREKGGE